MKDKRSKSRIPVEFPTQQDLFAVLKRVTSRWYIKDCHGRFAWGNDATLEAHGYKIKGRTDADFFDKDHTTDARSDELQIINRSIPFIVDKEETEKWRKDGRIVQVLSSKFPLYSDKGKIVGIIGTSKDITDLVNRDEVMRQIFDALPECVFFKNLGGQIREFNKAFEVWHAKLNITVRRGCTDGDLWPNNPELVAQFKRGDRKAFKDKQFGPVIEHHKSPDGSLIEIETSKYALCDARGKIIGLVGMFRDVTERRRTARKEFYEEFASNLAHSIRNNTVCAMGNIERTIETTGSTPSLERTHQLLAEIHRVVRLIGDARLWIQISKAESLSMSDLLSSVANVGSVQIVKVQPPSKDFTIRAYKLLLGMALQELVRNAQRFAKTKVEIWSERDSKLGFYSIHVLDDGPGLPSNIDQIRLFELGLTTNPESHTGVGLSFVEHVAEHHGGSISFKDSDTGAHAILKLPIHPPSEPKEDE